MDKLKDVLKHWLPIGAVATILCGLVYVAVQQELRISANDPQIQMAEDAAAQLAAGASPSSVVPATRVDLGKSLAPFLIVFDGGGNPVASSAILQGQTPQLPSGVLDYVRGNGEDRITWQPAPGIRMASVVVRFQGAKSGFVLAARSLREVERREDEAELEAGLAWLASLAASLALVVLAAWWPARGSPVH
jgi:hypothetical protein